MFAEDSMCFPKVENEIMDKGGITNASTVLFSWVKDGIPI